jgi:ubiquinone/menaquinone biosynthesis C-methylase UbiE
LVALYIHIVLGRPTSQIPTLHAASKYLEHSIIRFYDPETFGKILDTIGFTNIVYYLLSFGAVAIHQTKNTVL